jgi:hypothetical protein
LKNNHISEFKKTNRNTKSPLAIGRRLALAQLTLLQLSVASPLATARQPHSFSQAYGKCLKKKKAYGKMKIHGRNHQNESGQADQMNKDMQT